VQPVREQLLANAGLAEQQHRQFGIGHHADLVQQLRDGLALSDDFADDLAVVAHRSPAARHRAAHA
jgi:hypothetical protein